MVVFPTPPFPSPSRARAGRRDLFDERRDGGSKVARSQHGMGQAADARSSRKSTEARCSPPMVEGAHGDPLDRRAIRWSRGGSAASADRPALFERPGNTIVVGPVASNTALNSRRCVGFLIPIASSSPDVRRHTRMSRRRHSGRARGRLVVRVPSASAPRPRIGSLHLQARVGPEVTKLPGGELAGSRSRRAQAEQPQRVAGGACRTHMVDGRLALSPVRRPATRRGGEVSTGAAAGKCSVARRAAVPSETRGRAKITRSPVVVGSLLGIDGRAPRGCRHRGPRSGDSRA